MSAIRFFHIDAFTDRPFAGNPAAVCVLDEERDDPWMQSVAAEMKVSDTAFVRPLGDGFALRWFTPVVEIELCGHATLASAHALWTEAGFTGDSIRFHTKSGVLTATRRGSLIELDFPATPAREVQPPAGLLEALGAKAAFVGQSKFDLLVVVASEREVRSLAPDFARLRQIPTRGVMVTSASDDDGFDFVSRFFAPSTGTDEDPVTGSAHCCLGPYWSERLGKTELTALQDSARSGVVQVAVRGDRVAIGGQAATVVRGEFA